MASGLLAEPWSADTRFSQADYRDVAEVAAIALTEDRLLDGMFELCAEGALDRHDVAAQAGEVLGCEIKAERIDPRTLGPGAAPMQPMFAHYDRFGLRGNALTLRAILGREPRTYFPASERNVLERPGETNGRIASLPRSVLARAGVHLRPESATPERSNQGVDDAPNWATGRFDTGRHDEAYRSRLRLQVGPQILSMPSVEKRS